jgi:hypothetical protein
MNTFTTLLDIRNDVADQYINAGLDQWNKKIHFGQEYNKLSRAIESYLGVDINTEHDFPETLEQLKESFSDETLSWFFNYAVREHGIPVTLIEETIAA